MRACTGARTAENARRLIMRNLKHVSIAVILFGTAGLVFAQGNARGGAGQYNAATETTITGTVDDVQNLAGPANGPGGLHLMVRGDRGTYDVHLGPAAYITSKHWEFAKNDSVTIKGSKMTAQGRVMIGGASRRTQFR
jgi:hypothetical protein